MKTAKLGVIFLVSVLALAGIGAGYAHWSQTLYIEGTVDTGTFKVGIVNIGTNDDPANADGVSNLLGNVDPGWSGTAGTMYDKDVASATSENIGDPKCTKDGQDYYERIKFTIKNAYPSYCPRTVVQVCNCGTIPAEISAISASVKETDAADVTVYDGSYELFTQTWTPALPASGTALDDIALVFWYLYDCHGTPSILISSGSGIADLVTALQTEYGPNIQLDECDCFELWLWVHFEQGPTDDELPMGHTIKVDASVTYTQWNLVP